MWSGRVFLFLCKECGRTVDRGVRNLEFQFGFAKDLIFKVMHLRIIRNSLRLGEKYQTGLRVSALLGHHYHCYHHHHLIWTWISAEEQWLSKEKLISLLDIFYSTNVSKCWISKYSFPLLPLLSLLGKAPMPRPHYKPQEPNGCSSYFLGLKVPESVCTTTIVFSADRF